MRFGKKPGDMSADADATDAAKKAEDTTQADAADESSASDTAASDTAASDTAAADTAAADTESADTAEGAVPLTDDEATDTGANDPGAKAGAPRGGRRRRLAMITAAAATVVFTLAAALSGWQWAENNGPHPADVNAAFVDQSGTAQAAQAARDIVQGVFSYSYQDLDAYQDSLAKFLNQDMLTSYQQTADQNVQIITQAKTTIKATVGEGNVGIEKLDGDKATAVVIMERSGTNGDSQQISDAAPMRVQMEKVDGQWKASDMRLL
ncbi:hypothetical protein [Tomitella fengzijianii]|uniref:Mce-associated membrane protein n=1 Tax=Tomitella fengzijianii TaxID=2597660 RepID=A0A516X0D1_9ACTN|nr:hypothetical protein [Tomitella fengzijianii]QDQ96554.1 hypothetical protein FO059_03410 [Tomitella fengzijianii]